jgi:hypothetical protein
MDDARIKALIDELDQAVPEEEAWVRQQVSDDWYGELAANRAGYLRLGLAYLHAAYADYLDPACTREPVAQEVRFREFAERYRREYQRRFPYAVPLRLDFLSGEATLWPIWLHRRLEDPAQLPQPAAAPPTPAQAARFSILAIIAILLLLFLGLWYVVGER